MPVPTYSVKIGFSSAQAGLLVFPIAFQTINGVVQTAEVFGNAYSTFFNGTYDDVTNDVVSRSPETPGPPGAQHADCA